MSGAEFKKFWEDKTAWPGNDGQTYVDDEEIEISGTLYLTGVDVDVVKDDDIVKITGGFISSDDPKIDGTMLEAHYKAWKKKQKTTSMIVECPVDKLEAIKDELKKLGAKIVA